MQIRILAGSYHQFNYWKNEIIHKFKDTNIFLKMPMIYINSIEKMQGLDNVDILLAGNFYDHPVYKHIGIYKHRINFIDIDDFLQKEIKNEN